MYRVLHITDSANFGGISAMIVNYYRFLDRTRIRFDVALTTDGLGQDGMLLRQMGADFHRLPLKSQGVAAYERALEEILARGNYDAIHVHESETSYVALRVAKKMGIRKRIAHSHTTAPFFSLKGEVRRLSGCVLNYAFATEVIGCGQLSGERVFGKRNMKRPKAVVLPNAIDTAQYAFEPRIRREVRQELGLNGKFAIGIVGRLAHQKNHPYALKLMEQLHTRMPEAVLLVVGNGEEEEAIRKIIAEKKLEDCVVLLGRRDDVARLYQGFDAMIMPSFYEGFPVAAVEAMTSGLPVLMADTITRELDFGSARYLKLGDDETWLRALQNLDTGGDRAALGAEVKAHGLDIRDTAKRLERIYLKNV